MATTDSQPETAAPAAEGDTAEVATEEVAAATETAEAAPVEGEQPAAEPEVEQTSEQKAEAEARETEIKAAAEKYAAEQITRANKTMAAARRAEARVADIKAKNDALTSELGDYKGFVDQLKTDAPAALARIGFRSVKEFLDNVIATGGDKPAPSVEERLEAAERRDREREEAAKAARESATTEAFQAHLFNALDEQKATYVRTATKLGKASLWASTEKYARKHGISIHEVPPAAIGMMADNIERDLRAEFGDPSSSPAQAAKTGNTAPGAAAPGARTSGKTLAGKATSGAPTTREYSQDPEERRKQVTEDMRAAGELG